MGLLVHQGQNLHGYITSSAVADKPHFAEGAGKGLGVTPYSVAEKVMVFSNHRNAWVEAEVNAVHRDGSCDVMYIGTREIKQVKLEDQATNMKKAVTPGVEAHQPVPVATTLLVHQGQNLHGYITSSAVADKPHFAEGAGKG